MVATLDTTPKKDTRALNKRSILNVLGAHHKNNKTFDNVWNLAPKAPMFCKKPRVVKYKNRRTGKTEDRKIASTIRISSSHKYSTLVSAAFARHARSVGIMCDALRSEHDLEDPRAPALPRISPGFKLLLDQTMIAFVQNTIEKAKLLQEGMARQTKHRKITAKAVGVAARAVDRDILGPAGLATGITFVPKMPSKVSKKGKGKKEAKKAEA